MIGIRHKLISLLTQWDPSIDTTSATFERQVLAPLEEYLGENDLDGDATAFFRNRMSRLFPDMDGSVIGDALGSIAETLIRPIRAESRASIQRRALSPEATYTGEDLHELRDFFFVAPASGGFARGAFRVFYPSPRRVLFGPTTVFSVPPTGGTPERRYRADGSIDIPQDVMRGNRSGTMYYVDVPAIAMKTGPEFNIETNTVVAASSVPGAARITVQQRFVDGSLGDTASTLPTTIRTSLRLRTTSTAQGLHYVLTEQGFDVVTIATPGDTLVTRDRAYGVNMLGGVPGGFRTDTDAPTGDYVHIGLCTDVWVRQSTPPQTFTLTNVVNVGVRSHFKFKARITGSDSIETAYRMFDFPTRDMDHTAGGRMIGSSTDKALLPSFTLITDPAIQRNTGLHSLTEVLSVVDERGLEVDAFSDVTWSTLADQVLWFRSVTAADLALNQPLENAVAIPLPTTYAVSADGGVSRTAGSLSRPTVGSDRTPVLLGGSTVATSFNKLDRPDAWPILRIDRLSLASGASQGEFVHHALPAFCEFMGPEPNASGYSFAPVRVRIHLFGPVAIGVDGTDRDAPSTLYDPVLEVEAGDRKFTALTWSNVNFLAIGSVPGQVETDRLSISGTLANTPLRDFDGNVVYDRGTPRTWRAGDHILDGSGKAYVISQVVSASVVVVAQKDVPVGTSVVGTRVLQGCSRQSLLDAGVNAEGTWSFDVFAVLRAPSGDPTSDLLPTANTQAVPTIVPFSKYNQGFSVYSDFPDAAFSTRTTDTLLFHSKWVCDADEVTGRNINIHGQSSAGVRRVQDYLDENRPVGGDIMCRGLAPAYVTLSLYYESSDSSLTPGRVADLVVEEISRSNSDSRVELTDLLNVVRRAGAEYVTSGRMFVTQQDHLRRWTWAATRGAVPLNRAAGLIPWRVSVVRIQTRRVGETVDELDPANWAGTFTLRLGGFDAD